MQPYVHYILHGRTEGRRSLPNANEIIKSGKVHPSPTKSTLMVAIHESSRTGAPLVGLELVKHLKSQFNIFTYIARDVESKPNGYICEAQLLSGEGGAG